MKVGDYVRTKYGHICKIVNINNFREPSMRYGVEANYLKDIQFTGKKEIYKFSPNIIDLIEVGDYVNGEKITYITNKGLLITDGGYDILKRYKTITSIVTKEQFESMEYKVGE